MLLQGLASLVLAGAPESRPVLEWAAPVGCSSEHNLRFRVHHLIDRIPDADHDGVHARAEVRAAPAGYEVDLRIEVDGEGGSRTMVAADCEALARTVALLVALAIDPVTAAGRRDLPAPEAPAPVPPQPSPAQPPVTPRPTRTGWSLRVVPLVGWGQLPRVGSAAAVFAGATRGVLRIEAGAAFWFRQQHRADTQPPVGGDYMLGYAALRGCALPHAGEVEVPLCLGARAGATHARGIGLRDPQVHRTPYVAGTGTAGIAWAPHPRLALWADLTAAARVQRFRFTAANYGVLYTAPWVSVSASVGVEIRWF